MSKRHFCPQQGGDRKKAKLDVTISDHNFPLSQNGPNNKEPDQNNWGDDNDDEILLLASQACEDAYNDMSSLPDYSMCMKSVSTSTQLFDPGPSTSKTTFNFKKPSAIPPSSITSNLKDKCSRISSPLPGMTSKILPKQNNDIDLSNDLIFNDKIFKGQDSDVIYKQLLQLQEENAKLKSENGKLLDKCVTKEGEASILRTQLKTSQVSVDNARMEKIKAQEKVQMEWTEKLAAANSQMHDLRTQLDFKNLEIISIKERCKLLESNKVKVNQVTVPSNDISTSQRMNNSFARDSSMRKPKMSSNGVQTDDKAHFLKLNKTCRSEPSKLSPILPLILEPTIEQHSILEYNEKLQKHTDLTQNKCRVYNTFHRIPSSSGTGSKEGKKVVSMGILNEALTRIAAGNDDGKGFSNILSIFKSVLLEVESELEVVSRKMSTAFQKEMDERYIDVTTSYLVIDKRELLTARALYKDEQAILARRITAVLAYIDVKVHMISEDADLKQFTDTMRRICCLLDNTSCALLYSGLLLSTTYLLNNFIQQTDNFKIIEIVKHMISSRPMPFVCCQLLQLLRKLSLDKSCLEKLCPGTITGNLRLDYDQGVLLYKKDSCYLQVILKQVEASLKCIEGQNLEQQALDTTTHLLALYSNVNEYTPTLDADKSAGCDCQLVLLQVIVYALRILAVMLKNTKSCHVDHPPSTRLAAVCRSGAQVLYRRARDSELGSQLAHSEGMLIQFVELMKEVDHSEVYANMLSELSGSFLSPPEDAESSSFHKQPWVKSFENFSIAD